MTRERTRGRRIAEGCLLVVAGLAVGLVAGEALLRLKIIAPPRQIVRGNGLRQIDGVPVWADGTELENRECVAAHPERLRLLFFGSSITRGAGLDRAEVFTTRLQDRLNELRPDPGFCVMNFAQPGFGHEQYHALASENVPRYRPALVFDQDWDLTWGGTDTAHTEYRMIGDAAYFLANARIRSDGFPGLKGVPDGLNRALFLHSYLYQYLTLAFAETSPFQTTDEGESTRYRSAQLLKFAALVRSVGAKPAFHIVADLSYPLSGMRLEEREQERPILELAKREGFAVVVLRDLLSDQDNAAVRMDAWHLNGEGHRVLAERLVPVVLGLVDERSPP